MFKVGDKIRCDSRKDEKMQSFQWWQRHKEDIMTVKEIEEPSLLSDNYPMWVKENCFRWSSDWMILAEEPFDIGEFKI